MFYRHFKQNCLLNCLFRTTIMLNFFHGTIREKSFDVGKYSHYSCVKSVISMSLAQEIKKALSPPQ